ncbi:MAG: class I tRNA ligase family protein [Bacteroidia bacterium]|nr:class I tRNA ligase family protein [Bacteroidia bacterium]
MGYINIDEPAKKLINQGMIQGVSAKAQSITKLQIINTETGSELEINIPQIIIFKTQFKKLVEKGVNEFGSILKPILSRYNTSIDLSNTRLGAMSFSPLSIDINLINENDEIEIEAAKKWFSKGGENFVIIPEDNGKYISLREVEKMSKSKYNVVSPDSICEQYGADCLRLYEMFLGPLEQSKPWNTNGITGVSGFIKKLWRLFHSPEWNNTPLQRRGTGGEAISDDAPTKPELKTLHKTIKKIHDDIERFSFNTSVSNFMICVNELTEQKCNKRSILEPLTILIAPYAPHIAEELWSLLGHKESITYAKFPDYKEEYMMDDSFAYPVSFNGKTRFKLELPLSMGIQEIEKEVLSSEEAIKYLEGKTPKKVIIVPKKIVNIVM